MRLILALLLSTLALAQNRIVSTAPSFTETLFALGAGPRVVAVSTHCHFPSSVSQLPRVGSYLKPNIEAIARLSPDLVLVHSDQKNTLAQFAQLGIKTLALKNTSLEETLAATRNIGEALGLQKAASQLEAKIRSQLVNIEKRSAGQAPRTLLFIVGRTPGRLEGLIAIGKGSFLNEIMRVAGARNVLDDSPVTYPRISLEAVMRLDPDLIVDMGDMAQTTGITPQHIASVVELWRGQSTLRAVSKNQVFAVAADIFVVPGPRIAEAAEAFSRMVHK